MTYPTSGIVGASLTELMAGTTTNGVGAKFALGTRLTATDGSMWVYCQAGEAIGTAGMCVGIDEDYQMLKMTKALCDAGFQPGFVQMAFADNDMGWVCVHSGGNINMRVAASCAADVQLYTTATAGVLDDTSASQTIVRGCVIVVAASNTASTREGIAIYPSSTAAP